MKNPRHYTQLNKVFKQVIAQNDLEDNSDEPFEKRLVCVNNKISGGWTSWGIMNSLIQEIPQEENLWKRLIKTFHLIIHASAYALWLNGLLSEIEGTKDKQNA